MSNSNGVISKPNIDLDEITTDTEIPNIEPVITISDSVFAVKGDISAVTGLPKAGKTTVSIYMVATAFMREIPPEFDHLLMRTSYCEDSEVICIDTEQPKKYTKDFLLKILKILGVEKKPKNLKIYNLRKYSYKEKVTRVEEILNKYPKPHLVIIDGVADLVSDPNNATESFEIVNKLMMHADKSNAAIVLYLHENPGNGMMRGNLGSELGRKCGGIITIKKDKQSKTHTIESRTIRGSKDFDDIICRYDPDLGRMVSLNSLEAEEIKKVLATGHKDKTKAAKENKLIGQLANLAVQCFVGGVDHLKSNELIKRMILYSKKHLGEQLSETTAFRRRDFMLEKGVIKKDDDGTFSLIKDASK